MVLNAKNLYPYMIKSWIAILLLLPSVLFAQNLKFNGMDNTTKKWRTETFPINLKATANTKMDASLQAVDTAVFLQLKGQGVGTSSIDQNSELVLTLDDGSLVTARSTSVQSISYGESLPSYQHQYALSYNDLENLSRHNLQKVRKYSIGGFDDIAIENKNGG